MQRAVILAAVAALLSGCLGLLDKYQTESPSPPPDMQVEERTSPLVEQLGERHWRFRRVRKEVWEAALKVLTDHYNINIADRHSGLVTTEWDTRFLGKGMIRNKVTMLIQEDQDATSVKVFNNVETLPEGGAVWRPSPQSKKEIQRILASLQSQL